jgi:hypothetical protein
MEKKSLKGIILLSFFLSLALILQAQVQVRPLPKKGFEERIHKAVYDARLIDTHEHLMSESQALAGSSDFNCLFDNYQLSDMNSSGLYPNNRVSNNPWENIAPAWEAMKNTGYGRAVLLSIKGLFDIDDLNSDTYAELSKRIKDSHKPGFYNYVLKEKAKIDLCIIMGSENEVIEQDKNYYKGLMYVNGFSYFSDEFNKYTFSFERAKKFHGRYSNNVKTLEDYEEMMDKAFKEGIEKGIIGVKNSWAYSRTLLCEEVTRETASEIFEKMVADPKREFSLEEVKPLQDYLFFKVLDLCEKYNLPIQIHTGLQTYNGNYITNSNPTHLTNAFFKYPKVKFILLHSSYPYGGELAVLAKNFPNVYIDMAWTPIISPSYSIRYLQEFLETVPVNKIMVFGGDCSSVEGSYGASIMAREVVEKTLIAMVKSGYFNEEEAIAIVPKILRTNAIKIYDLKGF